MTWIFSSFFVSPTYTKAYLPAVHILNSCTVFFFFFFFWFQCDTEFMFGLPRARSKIKHDD